MNNSPEGAQGSANSPTPMTDCVTMNRHCSLIGPNDDIVFADFARTLERQLSQSEERVAKLEGALVEAIRFAEMNDEQWEQEDCPSEKIASLKAALLSSPKTN